MNNNIISILIIVGLILGFVSTSTANNLNNTTHLLTSNNTLVNETINKTLNITNNNTNNKILTYNPISAMVLLDTVYVSNKGNDSNTGEDWNNSIATLGAALKKVKNNGTILIGDGVYDIPYTVCWQSVKIKSENGPQRTIFRNSEVMMIQKIGAGSLLIDGVGFWNCSSERGNVIDIATMGLTTINNCIFHNCSSSHANIIRSGGDNAILTNCVFENCKAKAPDLNTGTPGLIFNMNNLIISNCEFRNNSGIIGGVIFNRGNLNVTSTCFKYNTAENGGVIYNAAPNDSNIVFKSCDFINNSAAKGIIAYNTKYYYGPVLSLIMFDGCYFDPNSENNFVGDVLNINQVLSKTNDTSNNTNTTNSTNSSIISTLLTKKSHMLTPLLLSYNPSIGMGETIIPASEKVEEPLTINDSNKNIITPLTILILLISSVIYMKHRS